MFQPGEYVVYGHNGVCRVNQITFLNGITGADEQKQYYILSPVSSRSSVIYCPVDNTRVVMRRLITAEEAEKILEEVSSAEILLIANDRQQEEKYKAIMAACDSRMWMRLIKTLSFTKKKRQQIGRKITSRDERYLNLSEEALFSELSTATGREKSLIRGEFYRNLETEKALT